MLKFVTKEMYWKAEDAGILDMIPKKDWWHIKTIQDAIAIYELINNSQKMIAEIGGSDSRTAEFLAKDNSVFNIEANILNTGGITNEAFEALDLGKVQNVIAQIGKFDKNLPDQSFDILYSISVLEHVANADIEYMKNFWRDCHRLLKPGGKMLHLIDLYLFDDQKDNEETCRQIEKYRTIFDLGFEPVSQDILEPKNIQFSCSFATNPDNMMNRWNKSVPELKEIRQRAQACTILLQANKV